MTGYNHRGPSPFFRPPSEMPPILCGPMLRRVTRSSVSVFLVLKGEASIALRLYDAPDGADLIAESDFHLTVPVGRHLHFAVVTLDLDAGQRLEAGHRYGYDLVFDSARLQLDGVALSEHYAALIGAGPFDGGGAITYGDDLLPSFLVPAEAVKDLRLVHGSCRKPHGEGADMLAMLDDQLRLTHASTLERPQLLIVTGDQIYADDVSPILLRCLNDSLPIVLGWRETVASPHLSLPPGVPTPPGLPPLFGVDELASDGTWIHKDQPDAPLWDMSSAVLAERTNPFRASRIAPPQRGKEVRGNGGLSSDFADAHLIFLGEFLLMYLFCWSDALWPRGPPPEEFRLPIYNEAVPSFSLFGPYSQSSLTEQRRTIEVFASGLRKVRRALANISTLMIFDDHEVTDDWNLNADWVARVNASPMGSQILRNALVAYALCQDWGSQPEHYGPGQPGARILEAVTYGGPTTEGPAWVPNEPPPAAEPGPPIIAGDAHQLDALLAIGPAALRSVPPALAPTADDPRFAVPEKAWSYVVEPHGDDTGYRLVFLDTRTRRGFPSQTLIDQATSRLKGLIGDAQPAAGMVLNAALLSAEAFRTQLEDQLAPDRLGIVVSPAPVFGIAAIENVAQRIEVSRTNPEYADSEAWSGHHEAMLKLVDLLRSKGGAGVVLLSGDVHYGFSHKITFKESPTDWADHAALQLCASSMKNETSGTFLAALAAPPERDDVFVMPDQRRREVEARLNTTINEKIAELGFADGVQSSDFEAFCGYAKYDWWDKTPAWWDPAQLALKLRDLNPLALPDRFLLPMRYAFRGGVLLGVFQWLEQDFSPVKLAYGVEGLKDRRPAAERDSEIVPAGASQPPEAARRFAGEEARQIVGYNNYGDVAFLEEGPKTVVVHRLHWPLHDAAQKTHARLMASAHVASLSRE